MIIRAVKSPWLHIDQFQDFRWPLGLSIFRKFWNVLVSSEIDCILLQTSYEVVIRASRSLYLHIAQLQFFRWHFATSIFRKFWNDLEWPELAYIPLQTSYELVIRTSKGHSPYLDQLQYFVNLLVCRFFEIFKCPYNI